MKLKEKIQKLHFYIIWGGYKRANYLRKKKILRYIGKDVMFQSRKYPMDPKLIKIHNNVVIAADVTFVTHDAIRHVLARKNSKEYPINVGPIEIMNNVFIGLGTIILPNVRIGNNVIIAAGSVVTKNVPDNSVYAGVPAKKICTFEEFEKKREKDIKNNKKLPYEKVIEYKWKNFEKANK